MVSFLLGKFYKEKRILAIIYFGDDAIKKCRAIAGATNPEEAHPESVRGAFGRITTQGLFENVVHVSSNASEARREIKLWFSPEEVTVKLFPEKKESKQGKRVWQ